MTKTETTKTGNELPNNQQRNRFMEKLKEYRNNSPKSLYLKLHCEDNPLSRQHITILTKLKTFVNCPLYHISR